MKQDPSSKSHVQKEQLAYAGVLDKLSHFAILFLAGSYATYIFNLLPPKVSIADIAANWHLRAPVMLGKTQRSPRLVVHCRTRKVSGGETLSATLPSSSSA